MEATPPKEPSLPSLEALQRRIDAVKPKAKEEPESPPDGLGMAMRAGVELVAGVGVGSAAGILLDRWLGTMPLFFLVCFCLGAAAGVLNLLRGTRAIKRPGQTEHKDSDTQ